MNSVNRYEQNAVQTTLPLKGILGGLVMAIAGAYFLYVSFFAASNATEPDAPQLPEQGVVLVQTMDRLMALYDTNNAYAVKVQLGEMNKRQYAHILTRQILPEFKELRKKFSTIQVPTQDLYELQMAHFHLFNALEANLIMFKNTLYKGRPPQSQVDEMTAQVKSLAEKAETTLSVLRQYQSPYHRTTASVE